MKRVLVTGASRGIGRAIALRLAKDGWSVAVHYGKNRKEAEKVGEELGGACSGIYQADLTDPANARTLAAQALEDGPLDALVNNAGVYTKLDYANSTQEEFENAYAECMKVNFESPATLIHALLPGFVAQGGGKVVNVASRVGHRGEAGASFYGASKSALINLTRALAVENAKQNIQHFAIAPGWVETAMARDDIAQRLPQIVADIPVGRVASPEDCASAVAFLLSEEASYLTGIVIDINGASYLR